MTTYNIRTTKVHDRASLFATAEFKDDVDAIVSARQLLRPGETMEVWRADTLVYRVAPSSW